MANVQLKLAPGALAIAKTGIDRQLAAELAKRLVVKGAAIRQAMGNYLAEMFNGTEVAQAFRGQHPVDLPAEFGLTDQAAAVLADGMANIIREGIEIRSSASKFRITIRAVPGDWSKYLNLPGAKYVSFPSEKEVPVLYWCLVDPDADIGQAAFDIVYIHQDTFGMFDYAYSRSERALMIRRELVNRLKSLAGARTAGGYVVPAIARKQAGKNFIEYTLVQPGVAEHLMKILWENL